MERCDWNSSQGKRGTVRVTGYKWRQITNQGHNYISLCLPSHIPCRWRWSTRKSVKNTKRLVALHRAREPLFQHVYITSNTDLPRVKELGWSFFDSHMTTVSLRPFRGDENPKSCALVALVHFNVRLYYLCSVHCIQQSISLKAVFDDRLNGLETVGLSG